MSRMTQFALQNEIKKALLELWLCKELSALPELGVKSCIDVFNAVSEFAITALQTTQEYEKAHLENVLVELCTVQSENTLEGIKKLNQIQCELTSQNCIVTDQDKIDTLESLAMSIIQRIQSRSSFEQAEPELLLLDQVSVVAARLAFAGQASLNENLDMLIRDFEHADEKQVLMSIHQDILKGRYIKQESQ